MTLRSEISEQPYVLGRLLRTQWDHVRGIADWIREQDPRYVVLAARGTSDNAGLYAVYLWGTHNRLPVALAAPSTFTRYKMPPDLRDGLVVGISQSGQSPDIVGVLQEGRRQRRPTLAIVNDPRSPLARAADRMIDIRAGTEEMVAATKTYTASLLTLAMLSVALSGDDDHAEALAAVPDHVRGALELEAAVRAAVEERTAMERCVVVGRGYDYATAQEGSLKLKELAYVVAERYSSADFRHGPIAVVAKNFPVLAVSARGPVADDVADLLTNLRNEHDADTVVISNDPAALAQARTALPLPDHLPEWLSPIVSIVPCQLFALHLARAKGFDPEAPRGLKKVTRTD